VINVLAMAAGYDPDQPLLSFLPYVAKPANAHAFAKQPVKNQGCAHEAREQSSPR
jgi:hypothetical protein